MGRMPEWSNGADCKSAGLAFGGSNPSPPIYNGSVAERLNAVVLKTTELARVPGVRIPLDPLVGRWLNWLEYRLVTPVVTGSSPVRLVRKERWARNSIGRVFRLHRKGCWFESSRVHHALVAQLAEAPDLGSGCCRFESYRGYFTGD